MSFRTKLAVIYNLKYILKEKASVTVKAFRRTVADCICDLVRKKKKENGRQNEYCLCVLYYRLLHTVGFVHRAVPKLLSVNNS